jgi:hypothetical protein
MAAQTLMIAAPFVTAWPDLIVGGLPKTTAHCQPPRPSSSRVYWTSRYSIDRPVAFRRRSGPQILVALGSRAKVAVMAAMGSKSREVIYGGRIIGARSRAEGAREAAQKAGREADRAGGAMADPDGSPGRTGAAVAKDRTMSQRGLWLATGQMPSL